jgi:ribulose-5-phosphate 4-epimerase/fuculose-1-phosphate aldolase
MDFSFAGHTDAPEFQWVRKGLHPVMEAHGHRFVSDPEQATLVVNLFQKGAPQSFRRRAQAIFVVSVTEIDGGDQTIREAIPRGYPLLVRSLSNLLIGLTGPEAANPDAHFITPEQGHYKVNGTADQAVFFEQMYARIEPLATSRLIIDNVFDSDLPASLWNGDAITDSIRRAGERLDAMELLPAPFPIEDILSERELRQLKRLYGIGGLSYGNISARLDETRFWMSASGVDKSKLESIGRDILLVKDYDAASGAMILSVPPDVEPRRVSVDAIEHWMIYREHPEVGAILHVHGWIDGVRSTQFNYPCGTYELGKAVADIVREDPNPGRAVVGLKNHGLTITGASLDEIFERIDGRLLKYVPMD